MVTRSLLLLRGDGSWSDVNLGLGDWERGSSRDLLGLSDGGCVGVALLGLSVLSWEQDELRFVCGQSLDVGVDRLLGSVLSSVVYCDSDRLCELSWDTSNLQLLKRETSSGSDLHVVFGRWAVDDRSERIGRSWSNLGCLLNSSTSSSKFLAWLVEPGLDSRLPILSEMVSR